MTNLLQYPTTIAGQINRAKEIVREFVVTKIT